MSQVERKNELDTVTTSGYETRTCLHCKTEFRTKCYWAKFCKTDCRMAHHNELTRKAKAAYHGE